MILVTRVVAFLALACTLAVPFTPLLDGLAARLAVAAQLERADVIVILGGGVSAPDRLSESSLRRVVTGVHLYHRRLAPTLFFSGGATDGVPEARVMAAVARGIGVPESDILTETRSTNTRTEAVEVAKTLGPRHLRRILLVTDPFHMRRSQAVFTRAGFEVLPAPADPWTEGALAPEGRMVLLRHVGQEVVALLYYRARGWL